MSARTHLWQASPTRSGAAPSGLRQRAVAERLLRLQREVGNRQVARLLVQRFDAGEHRAIGDVATGQQTIFLAPDMPVTYGEIVALGGDLFGDWPTLHRLANKPGITKGTRGEVWYALLVKIRPSAEGTKRKDVEAQYMGKLFDAKAKEAVNARYGELAAENIAHFPNPRKGDAARPQAAKEGLGAIGAGATYRENHVTALTVAAAQGQARRKSLNDALMIEAFGDHFLTDAFSSGHQATERADIKTYWNAKVPDFWNRLQQWLAAKLVEEIQRNPRTRLVPSYVPNRLLTELVALPELQKQMKKLPRLGFGDLVAGAVHDYFNKHGVQAEVGGKPIELVGDSRLLTKARPGSGVLDDRLRHVTDRSRDTFVAAVAAVQAGIAEVHRAHALGRRGEDPERAAELILREGGGLFAAETLIPKLAPDERVADPEQRSINWELPSVENLLAEPRLVEGLAIQLEDYAGDVAGSLSLGADQMNAVQVVLTNKMLGGPDTVVKLIREVLAFVPPERTNPGPLLQDLSELKGGAR